MKTPKQVSKLALSALKVALKKYGTYQFDDKGPSEVIDVDSLVAEVRELSSKDAAEAIKLIVEGHKDCDRGATLARSILGELQGYEKWLDEVIEATGMEL